MRNIIPSPDPTQSISAPHLRLVREEDDAPYDGQSKAERNAGERFGMTPACVWALHEPYPILVYGALAIFADRDGVCWPSMATLAHETGISERSVLRAIERLEEAGLIVRERTALHGMKSANRYRLLPHKTLQDQYRQSVSTYRQRVSQVLPESQFGTDSQSDKQYPGELNPEEQKESAPAPKESKPRRKPETSLPGDFTLTPERVAYARDKGMSERRATVQFERFCNHAQQNERKCRDWNAAWRNWVLGDIERHGKDMAKDDPATSGMSKAMRTGRLVVG